MIRSRRESYPRIVVKTPRDVREPHPHCPAAPDGITGSVPAGAEGKGIRDLALAMSLSAALRAAGDGTWISRTDADIG